MNYEKAYNEALERAKKRYYAPNADKIPTYANRVIEEIFPELGESEDEKIRKWLLDTITQIPNHSIEWDVIEKAKVLAWLKKQEGQQKPTWSDKDEEMLKWTNGNLTELKEQFGEKYGKVGECISWLKSLKERLS